LEKFKILKAACFGLTESVYFVFTRFGRVPCGVFNFPREILCFWNLVSLFVPILASVKRDVLTSHVGEVEDRHWKNSVGPKFTILVSPFLGFLDST